MLVSSSCSLHFCETRGFKIPCHGVQTTRWLHPGPCSRHGSMKPKRGRGQGCLTQAGVITGSLAPSCLTLLSIVQQVENRKSARWEGDLHDQERSREVRVLWCFLFCCLNLQPHAAAEVAKQKYLHRTRTATVSGKINEPVTRTHLVSCF